MAKKTAAEREAERAASIAAAVAWTRELPKLMLEQLARAEALGLRYKVTNPPGRIDVTLYLAKGDIGWADSYTIQVITDPTETSYSDVHEYDTFAHFISTVAEHREKAARDAALRKDVLGRLTADEKRVLGLTRDNRENFL